MTTLIKEFDRGKDPSKLSAQQRMFVEELLADPGFNITAAARKAGYKHAPQSANRLIKNKVISRVIGKKLKERSDRLEFTADQVLDRLRVLLEVDLTHIYDDRGYTTMAKVKALPDVVRQCITKVTTERVKVDVDEDGLPVYENKVHVEWMSKDAALQLAMKHFGLLSDNLNISLSTERAKEEALIDLLDQVNRADNIIDSTAIEKLVEED